MVFRWNDWNVEHLDQHAVSVEEAETVVRSARTPFPLKQGEERWLVWGRGRGGRFLWVIAVLDEDEAISVIHARPLTVQEKRR
jgi:uncharacterized DUF497 family protein